MDSLTVASLFTAAGAGIAALVIRQLVQVLKAVLPPLDSAVSGALQAFILSALLYVLAAIALPVNGADGVLNAIVTWLTCASAAIGIDVTWNRVNANSGSGS